MKIINKTNHPWVGADRGLIRDSKIDAKSKLVYLVLLSIAQSCNNVFPSMKFIAEEIGASTEGKSESAVYKLIGPRIKKLQKHGLIKVIEVPGSHNNYEVYDYPDTLDKKLQWTKNSSVKNDPTLDKKLQGTLDKKLHPTLDKKLHRDRRVEKEENRKKSHIGKSAAKATEYMFSHLWEMYGKKVNRKEAVAAFAKVDEEYWPLIEAAIPQQQADRKVLDRRGEFVAPLPNFATWLRKHRWEDEILSTPAVTTPGKTDYAKLLKKSKK